MTDGGIKMGMTPPHPGAFKPRVRLDKAAPVTAAATATKERLIQNVESTEAEGSDEA